MLEIEQRVQGGTAPAHQSGVHEGFSMGYLRDLLNEWHAHGVPDDAVVTTVFLHVHAYWTEQREEMAQPDSCERDCICDSNDGFHDLQCPTAVRLDVSDEQLVACVMCDMPIELCGGLWLHVRPKSHRAVPPVSTAKGDA